ncbi:MAG: transposase [Verrucomicrobiales bacterium]
MPGGWRSHQFVGKGWLSTLRLLEVPYIVRVKHNTLVGGSPASWMCARNRWRKRAGERFEVFGQEVHFAAKRIKKGRDEYLAVIAHGFSGDEALRLYRLRWGIETLFSHLKKRGFQFEDTHMTKKERIEKLMGVLAVAFALCYRRGKNHGYRAKSIFRKGMESLHRIISKPRRFAEELAEFIDVVMRRPLTENFVV